MYKKPMIFNHKIHTIFLTERALAIYLLLPLQNNNNDKYK